MEDCKVLEIRELEIRFRRGRESAPVVRGASLAVARDEALALVGESGCGKTLTALSTIRLLPRGAEISRGTILLDGQDVTALDERGLERTRGRKVGMIFQEPSSYLNPVFTAGAQVEEAVALPTAVERRERTAALFRSVGLDPSLRNRYPHQLSGGMQQRVMIAMALANNPPLLIADEPTTALDVTTALQIVELLRSLMASGRLGVLFITHDISLAAFFAPRAAVMYAGRVVETGPTARLVKNPGHPYTESLLSCLPERYAKGARIAAIPGSVPDWRALPPGCAFHPRCPYRMDVCARQEPGVTVLDGTEVRCFRHGTAVEG